MLFSLFSHTNPTFWPFYHTISQSPPNHSLLKMNTRSKGRGHFVGLDTATTKNKEKENERRQNVDVPVSVPVSVGVEKTVSEEPVSVPVEVTVEDDTTKVRPVVERSFQEKFGT